MNRARCESPAAAGPADLVGYTAAALRQIRLLLRRLGSYVNAAAALGASRPEVEAANGCQLLLVPMTTIEEVDDPACR
jgi:hypothetical protein